MQHLFDQTCTIERWTRTTNSEYELVPDWDEVATGVACHVQEHAPGFFFDHAGNRLTFNAVGYFDASVDLRPQPKDNAERDRIVMSDGATYYVKGFAKQVPRAEFRKAYLERT